MLDDFSKTGVIIIGSGFAGAATAWALAKRGVGPGVILERELVPGTHASGRNAAMARQIELDPVIRALAIRSQAIVQSDFSDRGQLVRRTGSLILGNEEHIQKYDTLRDDFAHAGVPISTLRAKDARRKFPFLNKVEFEYAAHCPTDGVVDVHALLTRFLQGARSGGVRLKTGCQVQDLIIEEGRVRGVITDLGTIMAPLVVDASGAWAGRLGQAKSDRPWLTPMRRHLFITSGEDQRTGAWPFVWDESAGYYFRPEGSGLLFSACDESSMEACLPPVDPEVSHLLAKKLSRHAPGMWDRSVQRAWACLRTFAQDRRPIIGPDPRIDGLFHVSGLGGFGMTCSAAVGEVAAQMLTGQDVALLDPKLIHPSRHQQPRPRSTMETSGSSRG